MARFCKHLSAHPDLMARLQEEQDNPLLYENNSGDFKDENSGGGFSGSTNISYSTLFKSRINCSRVGTKKLVMNLILDDGYS